MPKIEKILTLEITPERFVKTCSDQEFMELLIEVDRRLNSEANRKRMEVFKIKKS